MPVLIPGNLNLRKILARRYTSSRDRLSLEPKRGTFQADLAVQGAQAPQTPGQDAGNVFLRLLVTLRHPVESNGGGPGLVVGT
jgi:hypothetical protein